MSTTVVPGKTVIIEPDAQYTRDCYFPPMEGLLYGDYVNYVEVTLPPYLEKCNADKKAIRDTIKAKKAIYEK